MDTVQAKALMADLEGKIVGGWEIFGSHGFGKSAVVMKGVQGDTVGAVKVFHPELIERYGKSVQLERIEREKSLIGEKHDNLVQIYDGGECHATGYLYVVMESIPYGNLLDLLADVPLESVRPIISKLASAAMFLETKGLAHRDIKPENIAISADCKTVKLLDLGVLRPFGISNITDVDQRPFIGTLRYSSPEFLLRQEEPTLEGWRAVTFYQIGAVLHDLIMKREIFSDESEPYSLLVEAVLKNVPVVHCADSELVTLCNHCLVKAPETRLQLVNWQAFSSPSNSGEAVVSIKEKIYRRQKYIQSVSQRSGMMQNEISRQLKVKLENLCNKYQTRIGIAVNALDIFPLFRTESSVDHRDSSFSIVLQFEKDDESGFLNHLYISLKVVLIDENNGNAIYQASSCSFLSNILALEQFPDSNRVYFTGNESEILSTQTTEELLAFSAELAYEAYDVDPNAELSELLILNSEH